MYILFYPQIALFETISRNLEYLCGGALIHSNLVLTTAHSVKRYFIFNYQ